MKGATFFDIFNFFRLTSLCVRVLCLHVCRCITCRSQKSALGPLELEFTDSCELVCGYWKSNPGPLQEQHVF